MKKLLTVLITAALLFTVQAKAQIVSTVTPSKTSLSSADTASAVLPISNVVTAVEIGATKTSGTVAGKVYFQGLNLKGDTWTSLDSLTVANSSGYQYKQIAITTPLHYSSYRFYYLSTNGVWVPSAYYLRRQ